MFSVPVSLRNMSTVPAGDASIVLDASDNALLENGLRAPVTPTAVKRAVVTPQRQPGLSSGDELR